MIGSFASVDAARLFRGEPATLLPTWLQPAARRKLRILAAATCLEDLERTPGGIRNEDPNGSHAGQYSVPINAGTAASKVTSSAEEWRIYFRWHGGAFDVGIE